MKILSLALVLAFANLASATAQTADDYPQLKSDAEKFIADGSFAKAHEVYAKAKSLDLPAPDKRWVDFRLADTLWRSEAATQNADTTKIDDARHQLEVLIRDITRVEDHDRVWVEVEESLGDFFWTRRNMKDWNNAWPYYQAALDWWAGAADLELARQRYLKLVWTMTRPPGAEPYYFYGYYGSMLPLDILENTLKIAQSANDQAHAHYLIAMTLRNQGGDWEQRQRVPEEFEAAIKPGKATDWYDDALYNYAEWMLSNGRVIPLKDGNWRQEPDYKKALELLRRFAKEFQKGESRYYEQAQQQIKNITEPGLSVSVANVFLPDSEIQYSLNWRNVKRVSLALYAVDLTRDVKLSGTKAPHEWLSTIDVGGLKKIKSWNYDTKDKGDYVPGGESLRLEPKLPLGAYVLEARANGKSARELVLVSDATLVLKVAGIKQALVYVCDALTGAPLADADVRLLQHCMDSPPNPRDWYWRESTGRTDKDGLLRFDLHQSPIDVQLFVAARTRDRQAFTVSSSYYRGADHSNNPEESWKIYAATDRPAYRPGETAQWKFTVRKYDGAVYSTPSGQTVEYRINDPRGAKVSEGKAKLNSFGSAWGSVELIETMPLGEYHVVFWDEGRHHHIGNATLFRLEEYKLPEFKVSVQTPEENGRKKAFRLGEKVEVNVQADYYFGGAVANASVEVVVYQNPLYHYWHRPREFPWLYEDTSFENQRMLYRGGQGPIIKRETLKTDATGKASLTFDTPRNQGQDFEYRIEARVTDASRREIIGNGSVRVTRQRYYVYPQAAHNLFRPQDKVSVEFRALDANEQPVQTEATVKVMRDYWFEIWVDPSGREVKGDELKRLQKIGPVFPPPPKPGLAGWVLKFRGYEHDDILTRTLKTDTNGLAELAFTPEREGYYRVAWSSQEAVKTNQPTPAPITAETTVWVATTATAELGYRHGGMEIIVDKDTFRVGEKAPVMLSVPANDSYVLFSVEGEDLYSYQLVHITGTVKLVELPIEEKHVPNIYLGAALVSDRQLFTDAKQIIVPPVKNFLTIDVKPDRDQYQPREDGIFNITARDDQDRPVATEVSFGLVDESVYYIQSDYAGDPRQFFFGQKRPHQVELQSTFNQKSYAKLVEGDKKQLIDIRDRAELDRAKAEGRLSGLSDRDKDRLEDESAAGGIGGASYGRNRVATKSLSSAAGGAMLMDSFAADAPMAAAPASLSVMRMAGEADQKAGAEKTPAPGEAPVQVRSDFRSTILWQPDVMTGADGKATIKVKYPDSLTGWKATARAVTEGNQFGIATTNTRTKQPLIVRLQAPRFFVVGDLVTISAVINNNTGQALQVSTALEADGLTVSGLYVGTNGVVKGERAPFITVEANGEARADWAVTVLQPGTAKLKVTARGAKYSDAMEKSYTIYEHGLEKFISKSGKVRGDEVTVKLNLPKERKAGSTSLAVQITPSMAVTMLDALPYLIDYPYGCTEQTMSRFLPAAITAKTLKDLGLKPEDVMGHVFGGIETNTAAATHPKGKHDLAELDKITKQSLERLYDFQHSDGGWGWWKQGDSDHFMTAYVVWGLTLARDAGISVKAGALSRGAAYLDKTLVEEELNLDQQAWMLHALATFHASEKKRAASAFQTKAFDNLWANREKLNAYTRALLALSAHHFGYNDKAKTLIENLENGVKIDNSPDTSVLVPGNTSAAVIGTAHWGEDGVYWRWSDGGVEATAFALRALLAIDPQNKLIEPVSNWLIKNRRGAQWSNTRDTAIAVLAMNDYLRVSGELTPELEYELSVNGESIAVKKVSGADVFSAPSRFAIDPKFIRDGDNDIRIVRRGGKGPIYFAADATFFSLEEPVTPAGNEIFAKRQYYKLVGRPTLLKGYVYDRQPLNDGETVKSGERVETVITIETKNNYEYLLFEDLKPAGLEAAAVRSGESLYAYELKSGAVERKFGANENGAAPDKGTGDATGKVTARKGATAVRGRPIQRPAPVIDSDHTGRSRWVYQELRDRKVAMFIDKLPQGVWEIKYDLRAEVPGEFHALPVMGHAMYVPEIRCNGAETRITVTDVK
jgi:uncharacterized protein YfaS (alpha-2-macroglobulin family)